MPAASLRGYVASSLVAGGAEDGRESGVLQVGNISSPLREAGRACFALQGTAAEHGHTVYKHLRDAVNGKC
ncbi:hypothetical protein V5799_019822 [Amblyomma americanum]|uniref:Uncharacterized protein n=1 Tax=Amblyomma americanum TaxID=6943 RepID=A0AAQ4EVH6_AMBAM